MHQPKLPRRCLFTADCSWVSVHKNYTRYLEQLVSPLAALLSAMRINNWTPYYNTELMENYVTHVPCTRDDAP